MRERDGRDKNWRQLQRNCALLMTSLGILLVLGWVAFFIVLTLILQRQFLEVRTIPARLLAKKQRCELELRRPSDVHLCRLCTFQTCSYWSYAMPCEALWSFVKQRFSSKFCEACVNSRNASHGFTNFARLHKLQKLHKRNSHSVLFKFVQHFDLSINFVE